MASKDIQHLVRVESAELSGDHSLCRVHLEVQHGEKLILEFATAEIGGLVSALAQVAAKVHAVKPGGSFQPMPLTGLGVAPSPNPDESLLMVQLPGLDLTFSAPSDRLADATAHLSMAARTLTAKGTLH